MAHVQNLWLKREQQKHKHKANGIGWYYLIVLPLKLSSRIQLWKNLGLRIFSNPSFMNCYSAIVKTVIALNS